MFVPWNPATEDIAALPGRIDQRIARSREEYAAYYETFAEPGSPALRDSNPSVVVVPGIGLFGFGKDKREARITTEFFVNAIQVMAGATALEDRSQDANLSARTALEMGWWQAVASSTPDTAVGVSPAPSAR